MRVRLGTPFRECSSSVEHSSDTREVKRAARWWPSPRTSHHFRPCGVVQPTRLPLMQEITGAKPVRDANFSLALKALSVMPSLGKRTSPVQFRVRDSVLVAVRKHRSRTSVQMSFISSSGPGQHRRLRPFLPPRSSLRMTFVKSPCRSVYGNFRIMGPTLG